MLIFRYCRWTFILLFGRRVSKSAWWLQNTQNTQIYVNFLNHNLNFDFLKKIKLISREWLFETRDTNEYEGMVHEERPGGFNWAGRDDQE